MQEIPPKQYSVCSSCHSTWEAGAQPVHQHWCPNLSVHQSESAKAATLAEVTSLLARILPLLEHYQLLLSETRSDQRVRPGELERWRRARNVGEAATLVSAVKQHLRAASVASAT